MKHIKITLFLFALISFSACNTIRPMHQSSGTTQQVSQTDGKILAAAFQQASAEYKALAYQAYNVARLRLDQFLKLQTPKPKAIMTDIDETILDNSPYQVHQALLGKDYDSKSWHQWTALADAYPVPGAPAFFQYAASKGVEVFYVTNRDEAERKATIENLRKYNFPNADNEHLLLQTNTSSKVERRNQIMKDYTLIMQFGDNLNDFSGAFEKGSIAERDRAVNSYQVEFGNSFIVIPNPSYGEWENALYDYKYNLTPAQKDAIYKEVLRSF